jgi:hypothetical protein
VEGLDEESWEFLCVVQGLGGIALAKQILVGDIAGPMRFASKRPTKGVR